MQTLTTGEKNLDKLLEVSSLESSEGEKRIQAYKNFCKLACTNFIGNQPSVYGNIEYLIEVALQKLNLDGIENKDYESCLQARKVIESLYSSLSKFIDSRNDASVLEDVEKKYVDQEVRNVSQHQQRCDGYTSIVPESIQPTNIEWVILNQKHIFRGKDCPRTLTPRVRDEMYKDSRVLEYEEKQAIIEAVRVFIKNLNHIRNLVLATLSDKVYEATREDRIESNDDSLREQIRLINLDQS